MGQATMNVQCPNCNQKVAETFADAVVIRHRGREIVAESIRAIRCEKCNHLFGPIQPERNQENEQSRGKRAYNRRTERGSEGDVALGEAS